MDEIVDYNLALDRIRVALEWLSRQDSLESIRAKIIGKVRGEQEISSNEDDDDDEIQEVQSERFQTKVYNLEPPLYRKLELQIAD